MIAYCYCTSVVDLAGKDSFGYDDSNCADYGLGGSDSWISHSFG